MTYLFSINKLKEIGENIENIDSPESLQEAIQEAKDICDQYNFELKSIPGKLERWKNVLKDLGIYKKNTDAEDVAEEVLVEEAKSGAVEAVEEAQVKLKETVKELEEYKAAQPSLYEIGGIPIDHLYNPNPSYSTDTITQSIISSKNVDRVNEDAENANTTLSARIILKGDDSITRLNSLKSFREKKKLIKLVFNQVYDKMLITEIRPKFDSSDSIEVELSFEHLFVAGVKRTKEPIKAFEQPTKKKTTAGKQGSMKWEHGQLELR